MEADEEQQQQQHVEEEENNEEEEEERIVLTINDCRYDVTDYAPVHPGEGHNDIYLEDYAGKDVTKEFLYYHSKKDKPVPQQILERVNARGKYKKIVKL